MHNKAERMRARLLSLKGALVAIALTMIYVGLSGLMADSDKVTLQWGQACDDMMCSPAAMLLGGVPEDESRVIDALRAKPQFTTLCLQSQGGSSGGAMALADWLSNNSYNTCVPRVQSQRAVCSGACAVVFAGGQQRQVDKDVAFGIHGGAVPGLIRQQPNALTDEPGTPAGSGPWQRQLSIQANQLASRLAQTLRFGFQAEPMARLLREAALVPAHTFRRLTAAEMADWQLISKPADKELVWLSGPKQSILQP